MRRWKEKRGDAVVKYNNSKKNNVRSEFSNLIVLTQLMLSEKEIVSVLGARSASFFFTNSSKELTLNSSRNLDKI